MEPLQEPCGVKEGMFITCTCVVKPLEDLVAAFAFAVHVQWNLP